MLHFLKYYILAIALFFSQIVVGLESADEQTIQTVVKNYTEAWNRGDGTQFAADFTEDADFVNIFGDYFSGRDAIAKRHVEILTDFLKDSQLEVQQLSLREVQPSVVIALVHWKLHNPFAATAEEMHATTGFKVTSIRGTFTHVFIRAGDKWQITASQNTINHTGKRD